jgi:hypothetical protein
MNQHLPGQHLATCNPDNCLEWRDYLSAPAAEKAAYIAYDTARNARLRAASKQSRQFRVSQEETYAPPHSYALTSAQLREREATPELRAEAAYKTRRMRELADEHARIYAHIAANPGPRLTDAELSKYAPPDSYGLAKKERR